MKLFIEKHISKKKYLNIARQFVKFGIVGIANTFISLLIYYALIYFKTNYILANTIGFIVSVINAYYWNNKFVFKKSAERNLKPLIKCFISYGITYLLITMMLVVLVKNLGLSEIIAPIINLLITIPLNFLLNKFWTFK